MKSPTNSARAVLRMPVAFPFSVFMRAAHREVLADCELGSWEDHTSDAGEFDRDAYGGPHPYEILQAQASRPGPSSTLRVNDVEEAEAIAYALASGTFQLYHYRVARRVFDLLLPITSEAFQTGYWGGGPNGM